MAQKPERFQGDDRKNAGHKVEYDAANKGGQHGGEHRWPLRLVGLRVGGVVLLDGGQGLLNMSIRISIGVAEQNRVVRRNDK